MAEKRELIKFVCTGVIVVKDGDKVLREETSDPRSCYSLEDMAELFTSAKVQIDEMNKTNRAQRRAK